VRARASGVVVAAAEHFGGQSQLGRVRGGNNRAGGGDDGVLDHLRVHYPVPARRRRTVDIAFTRSRVAVFVDGCFWHGCPQHGVLPSSNKAWWDHKIAVTKARDSDTTNALLMAGWVVLRFWEHESPEKMAAVVTETLAPEDGAHVVKCDIR